MVSPDLLLRSTLHSVYRQKHNLRNMFTSEKWVTSKWAKETKGKRAADIILMSSFWNHVVYILKVMGPLVRVLRLVDNENKPAMGYIYEAMDRAKETIKRSFNENEEKYEKIFTIIDERWNCQLHRPLHAVGYYLNPEFFYKIKSVGFDAEVLDGLYQCVARLILSLRFKIRSFMNYLYIKMLKVFLEFQLPFDPGQLRLYVLII